VHRLLPAERQTDHVDGLELETVEQTGQCLDDRRERQRHDRLRAPVPRHVPGDAPRHRRERFELRLPRVACATEPVQKQNRSAGTGFAPRDRAADVVDQVNGVHRRDRTGSYSWPTMHGTLLTWTARVERLPIKTRFVLVGLALAAVIAFDVVTGPDLAVSFPYSLCVMGAAWVISRRSGLVVAGLATIAAFAVHVNERGDEAWLVLVLNSVLRGVSFGLLALLASTVRRTFTDLVDTTRLDEMTGALSRRGFLDELGEARRRAVQRSAPLGVVYLDLDGLKEVNDTEPPAFVRPVRPAGRRRVRDRARTRRPARDRRRRRSHPGRS
jgi:hypothetical protein